MITLDMRRKRKLPLISTSHTYGTMAYCTEALMLKSLKRPGDVLEFKDVITKNGKRLTTAEIGQLVRRVCRSEMQVTCKTTVNKTVVVKLVGFKQSHYRQPTAPQQVWSS